MKTWFETIRQLPIWSVFGLMLLLVLAEWVAPRRKPSSSLATRWTSNVALLFINSYLVRLVIPVAGAAWAAVCQSHGWGLLAWVQAPAWVGMVGGVLILDLGHYLRHLFLHRNKFFWRIHITHHSDLDFDFTTGLRFHPLDAALSMVVILATVTIMGVPPAAVLIAEFLATASVLIEHSNVRIPRPIDRVLRLVVVTPDMHRLHHARGEGDTGSNLATTFSIWDRFFGTYRAASTAGPGDLLIGLPEFDDPKHLQLHWMLAQPFLGDRSSNESSNAAPSPQQP